MLYSVTVCTWYTHTHTYMHVTPLILTRHIQPVYADSHKIHTQSMALCADLCDTEFHPYWKNLTVRQKFIMSLSTPVTAPIHYVPQYTCHCTNSLCPSVHLSLHQFIMSLSTPVTAPIFTKLTIMQYSLWTYPVPYFTQTRKNHRQLGQHFYYISTQKSMAFTAVTVTVTKHTIPN